MAEALDHARQEFWRPPVHDVAVANERSATCSECRTEFIVGSRYCHSCGAGRPEITAVRTVEIPGITELNALGKRLRLTTPALIAFLFGALSLLAALAIGFLFTARTTLDWQAVQLWRIEWLLAAIAGFAAGLLLNKSS